LYIPSSQATAAKRSSIKAKYRPRHRGDVGNGSLIDLKVDQDAWLYDVPLD
jgi:hypothetical protein